MPFIGNKPTAVPLTGADIQDSTITSNDISYPLTTFSSTGIDDNATSTAITINSSQNVGIGTASPVGQLTLNKSSDLNFLQGGYGISWGTTSGSSPRIIGSNADAIRFFHGAGSEAMRIISGGNLLIGKTSNSFSTAGSDFPSNGKGVFVVNADESIICNRLTNDGNLIRFYQDGTEEGNITVSGSTVSYNGFTGTHWSRFTDNSTPNILRGTVLESLDEMCDWYNLEFEITDEEGNTSTQKIPYVLQDGQSDGNVITYNYEGTDVQATIIKEADIKHMKSKVSDTVDAKNVYGVFSSYDLDGEGYNDFYVASVGSFVVRIKQGETVAKGYLLQSNGDGTAKVQTDDAIRASTFAKVLSTTIIETYEDGSYLVPCSLMC